VDGNDVVPMMDLVTKDGCESPHLTCKIGACYDSGCW
jgi:hypothetical protein